MKVTVRLDCREMTFRQESYLKRLFKGKKSMKVTVRLGRREMTFRIGKCKKINYKSRPAAETACSDIAARGTIGLEPYSCDVCDGWHVGPSR